MIKVTIFKRDDEYMGFSVEGHANYAEKGKDIVCASVSVLSDNTIESIQRFTSDHVEYRETIGSSCVLLSYSKCNAIHPSWKYELLLKSFENGVQRISEQYHDYVTVKEAEA